MTGAQTVLGATCSPISRCELFRPLGIAVDAAGDLLVADADLVYRVDPVTGIKTLASNVGSVIDPLAIAIDAAGYLLVTDTGADSIFRIDPATRAQTTVSSGGFIVSPFGIAIDAGGQLVVADDDVEAIYRVDPVTGAQMVVSVAGDPHGIAIAPEPAIAPLLALALASHAGRATAGRESSPPARKGVSRSSSFGFPPSGARFAEFDARPKRPGIAPCAGPWGRRSGELEAPVREGPDAPLS